MQPLILRIITIVSTGLLIFEVFKGDRLISLDSSNSSVDSIIIIVAITGLLLGICFSEGLTRDSDSSDVVISPAEIATPTQTQSSEDSKSEQG